MSLISIRSALEVALNAMTPSVSTAPENAPFTPVAGTPYQKLYLMPAALTECHYYSKYYYGSSITNLYCPRALLVVAVACGRSRGPRTRTPRDWHHTLLLHRISL